MPNQEQIPRRRGECFGRHPVLLQGLLRVPVIAEWEGSRTQEAPDWQWWVREDTDRDNLSRSDEVAEQRQGSAQRWECVPQLPHRHGPAIQGFRGGRGLSPQHWQLSVAQLLDR